MAARALVTGGSSGLGRAIVGKLQSTGYTVISLDRRPPDESGETVHIDCDLSERGSLDKTISAVLSAGPYDMVFFNAGASATGRFEELPPDTIGRLMRLNSEAPMVLASTLMRERAVTGGMCFVASLSHFTGYPGAAVYAASKDALAIYAKSVRKPFGEQGVSVTLACPGPLRTEHAARHAPAGADASRRMAPPEAARAIVAATRKGRKLLIPGLAPRLFALAGKLAPAMTSRQMRKLIYDKLDGPGR